MKNVDKFKNTGFFSIGDAPQSWADKPRTIIVLGVARSGTSIVSGALHHLGVFSGDQSHDPVYEDVRLSNAIESRSWKKVNDVVTSYNNNHTTWCYKRPDIFRYISRLGFSGVMTRTINKFLIHSEFIPLNNFIKLNNRLRHPIYIITFKDMFAIANRNRLSKNFDILPSMELVLKDYKRLLTLLNKLMLNALLVSSEKAVSDKKLFLEQLIEFCQLTPSDTQRNTALSFISKDPKPYINSSHLNKTIGFLDSVDKNQISGWARYNDNERVATVILSIDGKEVAKREANLFRQDLLDTQNHSKGTCAFCFDQFDPALLKEGSEVSVKATEDMMEIGNCPFYYTEKLEYEN